MNTVARTASSVNWSTVDPSIAFAQFRLGWDLRNAGEPRSRCANSEQRRGWQAAHVEADAQCGIVGAINMITGEVII